MEFYPIDIAIHLVNILVLYILLRILLFKPIRKFMSNRQARIQAQLDQAAQIQAEAETLRTEFDGKLAEMEATCDQMMADTRKRSGETARQLVEDANEQAHQMIASAREKSEEYKQHALDDAKTELADLAVELSGRMLRFHEDQLRQSAQTPAEKNGTRSGILKTARACETAELSSITATLENLLGCHLKLEPTVDPSLVGGFAAFVDGKVYDFSYAAQLAGMKQALC